MSKLRVLDLFSGIGGFSLGLERTGGFETVAFCEIEPFPRKVLAKHWPGVPIYHDVRTLTKDILDRDGIAVDVICGGFPCQDISTAGKGAGISGGRSGLWKEYSRLVGELRPSYVIVENVAALLGRGLATVLGDLSEIGYGAEWEIISAADMGAPHRRERIWVVAYPNSLGWQESDLLQQWGPGLMWSVEALANPTGSRQQGQGQPFEWSGEAPAIEGEAVDAFAGSLGNQWRVEPNVGRVANGVPQRVDRLKALGNAVVPQIPELIGNAILQWGGDIRKARAA